jgi:hypothetical protein
LWRAFNIKAKLEVLCCRYKRSSISTSGADSEDACSKDFRTVPYDVDDVPWQGTRTRRMPAVPHGMLPNKHIDIKLNRDGRRPSQSTFIS